MLFVHSIVTEFVTTSTDLRIMSCTGIRVANVLLIIQVEFMNGVPFNTGISKYGPRSRFVNNKKAIYLRKTSGFGRM